MASRRVQLFGSLCVLVFLVNLARVVYAPLLQPLQVEFQLSPTQTGALATFAWAGSAAPRLPAGYALTRFQRHRVAIAAGLVLVGAATFAAAANSFLALGVGAFLMGCASGAYFIAANPLLSELFPERVGRAMGVHGTASQVAAVVAPLIVSALLLVANWRAVFGAVAVAGALATLGVALAARRTDLPDAGTEDRDVLAAALEQWRLIATGVVLIGVTGLAWNGVFNFYVSYLDATKEMTQSFARNVGLTLVFAAGVPAFLFGGALADRLPHVPLILGVVTSFAAALALLTAVTSVVAVLVATAAVGLSVHALFPALDTYLLDTLPDEHRGSAYAVYSATMMVLQAAGSVTVGALRDAGVPWDWIFRGFAAVVVAMALAMGALYVAGRLPAGGAPVEDEVPTEDAAA